MASKKFMEVGAPRLLALADILHAADALHKKNKEPGYRQQDWIHPCGTPACALGHWAAANPQTWKIEMSTSSYSASRLVLIRKKSPHRDAWSAAELEFAISDVEAETLFGADGCGCASTGKQAAKFIRQFVEDKLLCKVSS